MNPSRLPQSDSIQELAKFWDTHDVTEFEDQLEIVSEPIFDRRVDITVQLETGDANALREIANSRGVPEAELVREWVLERIHTS